MNALYYGRFDPVYPCNRMVTRHCPAVYDGTCDDQARVCARFESEDITPWLPELGTGREAARTSAVEGPETPR